MDENDGVKAALKTAYNNNKNSGLKICHAKKVKHKFESKYFVSFLHAKGRERTRQKKHEIPKTK